MGPEKMTYCRIGHMKQIRNMIPSLKFNMFDPLLAGLLSRNLFGLLPKN